ncbi:hypothetical protein RND81_13G112100 [Saponaria officinalis]|uniref:Uncharacterized protein n=1 Tax=Saponaria officinalis TaxID=3572 RepID=A0AAW1H4P8_SAPOF
MPGNEVGDRVHNFFDQSSSLQDQRQTQFVEANWGGFSNNVWGANERQIGVPSNTSSKNFIEQQSDIDRGNPQFPLASQGLNFTHASVRPEYVKSPPQVQQPNLNGYMHAHQAVNARQNETNFIAAAREFERHNMTSRGQSIHESHQRNVQQYSNSASFGGAEAPVNINLLGGQQQMSGQQPGMFQSLHSQQSGMNDTQLMQQQVMFKQMQELQRRQQLQQFEAMQNSMNHMSTFPNQSAGQYTQASNSNSVQDTSSFPWQSQVIPGGTNWQQSGQPSTMHAHSGGFMLNPDQGQAMRFMGFSPHQASQSLYGVPVSNSGGGNPFSQNSTDKPGIFHMSAPSGSFSVGPYAPHTEQVSIHDASTASRYGSDGKTSFEHASSQGLAVNLGGFDQVQQRKVSMSDVSERGPVGGAEVFPEKYSMQGVASQSITSQDTAGLDPTEEKILFGNDDNIWEAFGGASVTENDGADLLNGVPSLQSGTWSALMQSAVAETPSSDAGMQEEWSGLELQKSRARSGSQHFPTSQDNDKPPHVWVDSSERASLDWNMTNNDVSGNNNNNSSQNSRLLQPNSNQTNSPIESQVLQEGRRWLDSNSPKPQTVENRGLDNPNYSRDMSKTDTAYWSHRQNTFLPESAPDSDINSKADFNGPGLSHINISHESSQMPPGNHNLDQYKQVNFPSKSGIVGSGNDQQNKNKGKSANNSAVSTPVGEVTEMLGTENGDGRENYNDNHQNSFPNLALSGRENMWSDASNRQFLTEAPEIPSGHAGRRVPVAHKFQYHPMGDVHEGLPTMRGPAASLSDIEKGKLSIFHGDKVLHGSLSSSFHRGYLHSTSAPFARYDEKSSPNQHMSPSQNMLELLHKVDQSNDQNDASSLGSRPIMYNNSDIPAGGRVGSGQSQPSTSHGFNLQLAPPSQGIAISNLNDPAQSSLRNVGSPSSRIVSSEKGDKTHTWLVSGQSTQCLPPSHGSPQMDSGNDRSEGLDGSQSNRRGNLSASLASNSVYLRNSLQNQRMAGGQLMDDHPSSFVSSDRHAYHDQRSSNSPNRAVASQSFSNLSNNSLSQRDMNLSGMRASMVQMPPSVDAKMSGIRKDMSAGPHLRSSQQPLLGIQDHNASDMNVFSQQKKNDLDGPRSTDAASSPRVSGGDERTVADPQASGKPAGLSQDETVGRQSMEASPSNSAASQVDADVFHHSLSPNNAAHHSYPVVHQMQAMKTMGLDPNHRESKRLRGPDNGPNGAQMAGKIAEPFRGSWNSVVGDPSASQTSVSSGDARMPDFSPQLGHRNISLLPHGPVDPQDSVSFGRSDSQTFLTGNATSRVQLKGISPQMALSRYEQHGTSRNGQIPVHNVPSAPMVKNVDQQLIKQPCNLVQQTQNAVNDACQIANTNQTTNAYSASEQISSLHAMVPHVSTNPVLLRPLKRKTATSDLIPWNKEIAQGFRRIQNISSAEVDWAQSSNRFVERGGDETDSHKDMLPVVGPIRRLILTTKLMQQVFCPPSASILSLDARSNDELIMYSIARLALGNACNLICSVEKSESLPDNGNSLLEKAKTSETTIRDQYFLKVMKDFTIRAKDLENNLLRLDKRASILDFRLDCQDLERFSVINRFARFHGRTQADGGETSSSSDAKPFPQRYVTAHPMPRTVPERVQCLTIN